MTISSDIEELGTYKGYDLIGSFDRFGKQETNGGEETAYFVNVYRLLDREHVFRTKAFISGALNTEAQFDERVRNGLKDYAYSKAQEAIEAGELYDSDNDLSNSYLSRRWESESE